MDGADDGGLPRPNGGGSGAAGGTAVGGGAAVGGASGGTMGGRAAAGDGGSTAACGRPSSLRDASRSSAGPALLITSRAHSTKGPSDADGGEAFAPPARPCSRAHSAACRHALSSARVHPMCESSRPTQSARRLRHASSSGGTPERPLAAVDGATDAPPASSIAASSACGTRAHEHVRIGRVRSRMGA